MLGNPRVSEGSSVKSQALSLQYLWLCATICSYTKAERALGGAKRGTTKYGGVEPSAVQSRMLYEDRGWV